MEPVRTCVACRRRAAKFELVRLAFDPYRNRVVLDLDAHLPGRGCYVHSGCADRPGLARPVGRALRRSVDPDSLSETLAGMASAESRLRV